MKIEAIVLAAPKLLICNGINLKELETYENLSGPKHFLPVGSNEKLFFKLLVTNNFYNKAAEETNNYAASSERKAVTVDNKRKDTNAEEIQAKFEF